MASESREMNLTKESSALKLYFDYQQEYEVNIQVIRLFISFSFS